MTSDISCIKPWALIQYVEARSPDQLPLLWRTLEKELEGEAGPELFFKNPRNRISVDTCINVMEMAKKATADEMAVFKAAFKFGRPDGEKKAGFFKSPFSLVRDMLIQAQRADMLAGKQIEFVTISNSHVIVRIHWPEQLALNRDFCLFEQGLYQALPKIHGLAPARLWERTCYFEGGPFCEYEIWWNRNAPVKRPSLKLFFRKKDRLTDKRMNRMLGDGGTAEQDMAKQRAVARTTASGRVEALKSSESQDALTTETPPASSEGMAVTAAQEKSDRQTNVDATYREEFWVTVEPSPKTPDTLGEAETREHDKTAGADLKQGTDRGKSKSSKPTLVITTPSESPEHTVTVTLGKFEAPSIKEPPISGSTPDTETDQPGSDVQNREPEQYHQAPPTTEETTSPRLTIVRSEPTEKRPLKKENGGPVKPADLGKKRQDHLEMTAQEERSEKLKERNRVETVSGQLRHLFDGLGRMVALMLSETNTGHPHVEHLKRMEYLLSQGDALRSQLHFKDKALTEPASPPSDVSKPTSSPNFTSEE